MEALMLAQGENMRVWLFFGCLGLFLILERIFPKRTQGSSQYRRWGNNAMLTLVAILTIPLVPVSFIGAAYWAQSHEFGLLNLFADQLPLGVVVVASLLLRGFISFATHLLNHKIPWLWRIHRVHHLDTELDVSSTVRFHPFEMPMSAMIGVPMVVLFGLSPWVLLFYELFDVTVTLFSHSNLKLPKAFNQLVRYVVVTPELHRIHHSSLPEETNCNFSAVLPVWDILFGTFRTHTMQPQEIMQLGLREVREPKANNFGWLLISPFVRFDDVRTKKSESQ